tara:strand:- start:153029 stop:153241 length:213 start_codon:yes stop_codon:yes gene_type:complete
VGTHSLKFSDSRTPLQALPAGEYRLVVEAVREVGGRELLRLPFSWPPQQTETQSIQGESELGAIRLTLNP